MERVSVKDVVHKERLRLSINVEVRSGRFTGSYALYSFPLLLSTEASGVLSELLVN